MKKESLHTNNEAANDKMISDLSKGFNAYQSIDNTEDWLKVKDRIGFDKVEEENSDPAKPDSSGRSRFMILRIAAAMVILLSIGLLAKQFLFTSPEIILISNGDLKQEVELPDGSKVFLNKQAELQYPEKFRGKSREVSLTGEAYFEVAENPEKLFRIQVSNRAIVEVLGTRFNIRSGFEDASVGVSVINGKVAFYSQEAAETRTILVKDEGAFLHNGIISKNQTENKNFLSWKTGILYFEDESIDNVLSALSKYYDKVFKLNETGTEDIRLTSTFDNQELESVLEEIELVLGLDFSASGDTIEVSKSY